MNVLVLMAGRNDSFADAGYMYPKNLVEIAGLPLIEHVIGNLAKLSSLEKEIKFLFIIRSDENARHHTGGVIQLLIPDAEILEVQDATAGAACTALLAIEHINNEEPLLICNGDQIVETDLAAMIGDYRSRGLDGGIVTFEAVHPRWSYVRLGDDGLVQEAAEKRPISKNATAGMYWFARGSDFVRGCMNMIRKDANVDGVFYLCPVYNQLILEQKKIGVWKIVRDEYRSLATPRSVFEYEAYLKSGSGKHA